MVTLGRPRVEDSRKFTEVRRGVHATKTSKTCPEFRVITLKEPVADPEWMFHHPRFQSETKSSESLPQIEPGFLKYTKKVFRRVPSARVNARDRLICERRERGIGSSMCRHFCELLGPNLCKDCWKLSERSDAVKEQGNCPSELQRGKDSFSVMIASREKRTEYNESEEEILDETEDEEFISKSPTSRKRSSITSPRDSGYSSRMSYIRSLSRTPSGDFCARMRSSSKVSTRERRIFDDEREKEISATNSRISSEMESTPIWKNPYLSKLREREPFKEILSNFYYPRKLRHAWRDLPVEPVVMDLKLINFTIYDGSPLHKRDVTKNCKA